MIKISSIKIGQQARVESNQDKVAEYAAHLEDGGAFPAVIVFYDGKHYWLADGHHRLLAHKRIGCLEILETVHVGGERDALAFALGANRDHGLPRTVADKRNAVYIALADAEWSNLSDVKIAKMCAVTQPFVSKVRHELAGNSKPKKQPKADTKNPAGGITVIPPTAEVVDSTGDETAKSTQTPEQVEPEYTELDELHDTISALREIVAVGYMDATPEDKTAATELIKELKLEVRRLSAEVKILTVARDDWQNQVAALKQQVVRQSREISKLTGEKR